MRRGSAHAKIGWIRLWWLLGRISLGKHLGKTALQRPQLPTLHLKNCAEGNQLAPAPEARAKVEYLNPARDKPSSDRATRYTPTLSQLGDRQEIFPCGSRRHSLTLKSFGLDGCKGRGVDSWARVHARWGVNQELRPRQVDSSAFSLARRRGISIDLASGVNHPA